MTNFNSFYSNHLRLKSTRWLFLALIALFLVACGSMDEPVQTPSNTDAVANNDLLLADDLDNTVPTEPPPTITPLATSTIQPTSTTVPPTDTPQPTVTSTPVIIPEGYDLLDSQEAGIRLFYPEDWFTLIELEGTSGIVTVVSDVEMLEPGGLWKDAAEIIVISDSQMCDGFINFIGNSEDDALAILTAIIDNPRTLFDIDELEIVQQPIIDPNSTDGHEIASAEIQTTYTLGNNVFTYLYVIKTFVTDTRFGLFLGNTERENEDEFVAAIRTVGDSVSFSEPIEREAQAFFSGDSIDAELTDEVFVKDYLYSAVVGETLNLTVIPKTENLNLILAIYSSDDPCTPLAEEIINYIEGETINYTFDTTGEYIIQVKDYNSETGFFSMSVEVE